MVDLLGGAVFLELDDVSPRRSVGFDRRCKEVALGCIKF